MALGFVLLDLLSHLQSKERRRFDFAIESLAQFRRHFIGCQLLLDQLDVLLTGLDILVPEPVTLGAFGQTQGCLGVFGRSSYDRRADQRHLIRCAITGLVC